MKIKFRLFLCVGLVSVEQPLDNQIYHFLFVCFVLIYYSFFDKARISKGMNQYIIV